MARRFFLAHPPAGPTATITGPEAHHLLHVLRAARGDRVVLFDGTGKEFEAQISDIGRKEITVTIVAERIVDRESPLRLTLAVALPKGDRQRWLVEKLVELGVAELIPLITARGVARPEHHALERLRRAVVEASKQCGRNRLMEITSATPISELLSNVPPTTRRLILQPDATASGGGSSESPIHEAAPFATKAGSAQRPHVIVAIGPEGGFSPEEILLANQLGWHGLSLGPRILRTETAAVAVAACLLLPCIVSQDATPEAAWNLNGRGPHHER